MGKLCVREPSKVRTTKKNITALHVLGTLNASTSSFPGDQYVASKTLSWK